VLGILTILERILLVVLQTILGPSVFSLITIVDRSKTIGPFLGYLTILGPKSTSFLSLVDLLGGYC
jgi:hypothetical protein